MQDNNSSSILQIRASWIPRFFFPLFKTIRGTLRISNQSFTFTGADGKLLLEIPFDEVKKFVRRGTGGIGIDSIWIIVPKKKRHDRLAFLINRNFMGIGKHPASDETNYKKWKEAFRQQAKT